MVGEMTARDALDAAKKTSDVERLRLYETICAQRGRCQRVPLENDPGRWTWCPDCLTVYDDYERAVNRLPGLQ